MKTPSSFPNPGVPMHPEPTPTPLSDLDIMPGTPIESRPLQIIVIADCSGSMMGEKIASLNNALTEAFDALRGVARENPTARLLVRAIAFDSTAEWHIAEPTPVENLVWPRLVAGGSTNMSDAIAMLSDALDITKMPERGLPPVLILVTDGMPDDRRAYQRQVDALLKLPWGVKAVRIGIGIGSDVQEDTLATFIRRDDIPVLMARNSADLTNWIRWATVAVTKAASQPVSQGGKPSNVHVDVGPVPESIDASTVF